jgi:hypothetical protein
VARRAVEFKFVVDFDRLNAPMLLGDVPSHWARDVFLNGYLSDSPLDRFMKPTVDYVDRLNDFVNLYAASFPFQNGQHTILISVKDDVLDGAFPCCTPGTDCPGDSAPDPLRRPCQWINVLNEMGQPVLDANGQPVQRLVHEYDHEGVLLQNAFKKHCSADATSPLGRDVSIDVPCATLSHPTALPEYMSRTFLISSDDLQRNGRLGILGLSAENYNYRIRDLAVNLVGSNVKDCTQVVGDQSRCYASAFISFDLIQTGNVELKDHNLQPWKFRLPAGGIRDGQALAAERLITTPIATADLDLLSQYWAKEFVGRPLQGAYELRLHDEESFNFDELVDVQIVVVVDYWTPFEVVP